MTIKPWIKIAIAAVAGFLGGGATGYFVRKKTAEVEFEEIDEEELERMMAAEEEQKKQEKAAESVPEIKRPASIQDIIDQHFDEANKSVQVDVQVDIPEEESKNEPAGIVQMDTQKTAYMNKWKKEAEQYDTRSDEVEDKEEEFDEEFMNVISSDTLNIETSTLDEWDRWMSIPDGEYDTIQLSWYEVDNVLVDENDDPVENQEKYVGDDIEEYFDKIGIETTGDPDVRVIINHKEKAIYQITRLHLSYNKKKGLEEYGGDDGEDSVSYIRSRH